MNEENKYSHSINRGNGTNNDALADIADLLVKSGNDNNKSQNKNFKWIIITTIITFISLLISIFK